MNAVEDPPHPVDALEEILRLMFPDREIDQDAFTQFRSFCDEPISVTQKADGTLRVLKTVEIG